MDRRALIAFTAAVLACISGCDYWAPWPYGDVYDLGASYKVTWEPDGMPFYAYAVYGAGVEILSSDTTGPEGDTIVVGPECRLIKLSSLNPDRTQHGYSSSWLSEYDIRTSGVSVQGFNPADSLRTFAVGFDSASMLVAAAFRGTGLDADTSDMWIDSAGNCLVSGSVSGRKSLRKAILRLALADDNCPPSGGVGQVPLLENYAARVPLPAPGDTCHYWLWFDELPVGYGKRDRFALLRVRALEDTPEWSVEAACQLLRGLRQATFD